jgi:general secretion pathway protein I
MRAFSFHDSRRISRRRVSSGQPRGLTLLEVLLSVAIFMGAMVALGQLISSGRRAASRGELQTEAVIRCESVVGRIVAGLLPVEAIEDAAFDDDLERRWTYSVQLLETPEVDLLGFQVTVTHQNNLGDANYSYSLQRFLRDPQIYADAAEAAANAAAAADTEASQ